MAAIDLSTSDQEPIHIPGTIQPHGVLLVLRAGDLRIESVSETAVALLGYRPEELLGKSVEDLVADADAAVSLKETLQSSAIVLRPIYVFTLRVGLRSGIFDAIAHRSGDRILFELEPAAQQRHITVADLYRLVQASIGRLRDVRTLQELYEVCATQIRKITGFDRVMVYRFDAEWNGQVVAEDQRPDLEPFLGCITRRRIFPARRGNFIAGTCRGSFLIAVTCRQRCFQRLTRQLPLRWT